MYQNLDKKGSAKIVREMNIIKIIKNIRYFKMVTDNLLMTPSLKFELKHSISNIIDVDCSQTEENIIQNNLDQFHISNQTKQKGKYKEFH